jgi:hypothetical protein
MKRINYVCTTCSQTFTRRSSGFRHNSHLHKGTAGIVHLIDYIVGRSSGKYLKCDPRDFRLIRQEKNYDPSHKKNGQQTNFDRALDSLCDYAQLRRSLNRDRRLGRSAQGIPFLLDFEKVAENSSMRNFGTDEYERARAELVAIQQMLTFFYKDPKFALNTVKYLVNSSNSKGNYSPIHDAYKRHSRNIQGHT